MKALLPTVLFTSLLFTACQNKNEVFEAVSAAEYYPTQVGKFITYRLDSTVYTQQGRVEEIHSYQEKNVIDAVITDGSGRTAYRVYRYLRNLAGTTPWQSAGTYTVTPTQGTVEVTDNNLRTVRLISPVKEGQTWKGNRYLPVEPLTSSYLFANDDDMADWDFTYESNNDVFSFNQQTYNNVLRVSQVNAIFVVDTVNVVANKATLPKDANGVWIRGNATDTVIIDASKPSPGHENVTIFNQTDKYVSFNQIRIPPHLAFQFRFANDRWYYPDALTVSSNKVSFPKDASTVFITGTATDNIQVDVSKIDTVSNRKISIYNKSNKDAFPNFNATLGATSIPSGFGRSYELVNGTWQFYGNTNTLLTTDPYLNELPLGSKNYSVEKYGKGLGMIYQELIMWEYQPNPNGTPYTIGFGVKRSIIDHN